MNRSELNAQLSLYQSHFPEEVIFKDAFFRLLTHPRAYHRDHLPGHITASAWIVSYDKAKVLLTHHAKLDRWLQPGGHADGDEDVLAVALKEANEETGLKNLTLLSPGVFDIDIHAIPARKDFPRHDHYDIRFAFLAQEGESITISEESKDLAWVSFADIDSLTSSNHSIIRMAKKISHLL